MTCKEKTRNEHIRGTTESVAGCNEEHILRKVVKRGIPGKGRGDDGKQDGKMRGNET